MPKLLLFSQARRIAPFWEQTEQIQEGHEVLIWAFCTAATSSALERTGIVHLVDRSNACGLRILYHLQECPICNYWYPALNTASCCSARLCTECFVMCQTTFDPPGKATCPFCKQRPFCVRVSACRACRERAALPTAAEVGTPLYVQGYSQRVSMS